MAYYTPANGDAQPVFALDVRNGPVAPSASTAGTPVQPQGPKLDFFSVTANTSVAAMQGVNAMLPTLFVLFSKLPQLLCTKLTLIKSALLCTQLVLLPTLLCSWQPLTLLVLLVPTSSAHAPTLVSNCLPDWSLTPTLPRK